MSTYQNIPIGVTGAALPDVQLAIPSTLEFNQVGTEFFLNFQVKVDIRPDDASANRKNYRRLLTDTTLYLGDITVTLEAPTMNTHATTLRMVARIDTKLPGTTGQYFDKSGLLVEKPE